MVKVLFITTEECLLNPNRNPQCSRNDIEKILKEYLGVRKILWIKEGVFGDTDTSGHVDNLCCFIRANEIALTFPDDENSHSISSFISCFLNIYKVKRTLLVVRLSYIKLFIPSPSLYRSDEDRLSLDKSE